MPTTADNSHDSTLAVMARVAGVAVLAAGVALALAFAAAAAVIIGLMIAGAAIALRFTPQPVRAKSETLEARRTPAGWVVETLTRRPS